MIRERWTQGKGSAMRAATACAALGCAGLAIAACGARTPVDSMGDVGASAGSGTSGGLGGNGGSGGFGGSGAGLGGSGASGGAGGGIFVDGGLGVTCPAMCGGQHAAPFELTTIDQVYRSLAGRWRVCGQANDGFLVAPADTVGVEFKLPQGSSPELLFLVDGPSGLVPGVGSAYRITYVVESVTAPHYLITLRGAKNATMTGAYRSCPTEHLVSAFNGDPIARTAWLVPVP